MQNTHNNKKCGLANLGNTCFINSILQVLSAIPELNTLLNDKSYRKSLNNNINSLLLIEWDSLREDMLKNNTGIISPNRFCAVMQHIAQIKNNNIFTGHDQNDVSEFLLFLIDSFHLALKQNVIITISGTSQTEKDKLAIKCYERMKQLYETDYSNILNIFHGILVSQKFNENNELINSILDPFWIINLSLPPLIVNKNPSLEECFDIYTSTETLDGDNMVFDETIGQKVVVKIKILFWSLPKILIIDLKRYTNRNMKLQQLLNFPINNLNLSKYVVGYDAEKYVYDLFGICNHSGGTSGGHYTSFVRENDQWYHCNDTQITTIDDVTQLITPKAYCLFYRMKQ